MKTKQAAFIAVAVLFRAASIAVALFGLFAVLTPLLAWGRGVEMSGGFVRVVAGYFVVAGLLWLLSKPAAFLVLHGLDVDQRFDLNEYREQ